MEKGGKIDKDICSFSAQNDGNRFFLRGGSSFCRSQRDQLAKKSEPPKRSILHRASVTESVLPSRKKTGNIYGDGGSAFLITGKRMCPVGIYLFKLNKRTLEKGGRYVHNY